MAEGTVKTIAEGGLGGYVGHYLAGHSIEVEDLNYARRLNIRVLGNSIIYGVYDYYLHRVGTKTKHINSPQANTWTIEPIGITDSIPYLPCPNKHGQSDMLVICEGEIDALALEVNLKNYGGIYPDIIGIPGSAHFKKEWAEWIRKLNYKDILIWQDNDEAGDKMAEDIGILLPNARKFIWYDFSHGDVSEVLYYTSGRCAADLLVLPGRWEYVEIVKPTKRLYNRGRFDPEVIKETAGTTRKKIEDALLEDGHTPVKSRGKNLIYSCPFHKEKTPSFYLDTEQQVYYCHGCHQGGDIISYYKDLYDNSYEAAFEKATL